MLTKKYPSTTRIVGIVLRSYIPNSGVTQPEDLYYWNDVMSGETLCQIAES